MRARSAGRQPQRRRRLDVDGEPVRAQARRHAAARRASRFAEYGLGPMQTRRRSVAAHVFSMPWARAPRLHVGVDALGRLAQRELAQRDQVALPEEVLDGALGLRGQVDLALAQALEQLVGRQIDELDLVGRVEHRVGHGLAHDDAGDLRDDVVQALDVLDVERRVDVDPGVEQLLDVLPALRVPRACGVRVRELVDQEQARLAREGGVEVELLERRCRGSVHLLARQPLEARRAASSSRSGRASRRRRRRRLGAPRRAGRRL